MIRQYDALPIRRCRTCGSETRDPEVGMCLLAGRGEEAHDHQTIYDKLKANPFG